MTEEGGIPAALPETKESQTNELFWEAHGFISPQCSTQREAKMIVVMRLRAGPIGPKGAIRNILEKKLLLVGFYFFKTGFSV